MNHAINAIDHETRIRRWTTFTPPQNAAHAAHCGLVLHRRSYTPGGTLAVNFSLATTDREKDRQGNWSDRTEWHNLVAYGRTAEIVRDYVSKGTQLFIQGKIQSRSWDDKESGQKRFWTEIFVHDLTLLGGGRGENGSSTHSNGRDDSRRSSGGSGLQPQQMNEQYSDEELNPDQIPF